MTNHAASLQQFFTRQWLKKRPITTSKSPVPRREFPACQRVLTGAVPVVRF